MQQELSPFEYRRKIKEFQGMMRMTAVATAVPIVMTASSATMAIDSLLRGSPGQGAVQAAIALASYLPYEAGIFIIRRARQSRDFLEIKLRE